MQTKSKSASLFSVGLTGGIASGKSRVTQFFSQLGVPVIDADIVAREVVLPGSDTLEALQALFTQPLTDEDGELDRKKLREIIFSDKEAKKRVEGVLHPAIRSRSEALLKTYADRGDPYVVCAIPLLVETGQMDKYDRIAVVDVPVDVQVKRVMRRDNTSKEDALAIINTQATREQRLAIAHDVIDNTGTLAELKAQVITLHAVYLQHAEKKRSPQLR